MSATVEPTVKPTEATTTEAPASTEIAPVAPETTPEAAIMSKDPEGVAENLAKAEVVETPEVTTSATTEETPAPATPEKKEGSSLLNFIKKHVPNPKGGVDKKAPVLAGSGKAVVHPTETPAKTEDEPVVAPTTEPVIVEPEEETPFEGGYVNFKSHGGLFGGGWKQRQLLFGKEDPYSSSALMPYVTTHKAASYVSAADKTSAAWENAAHASVTGVGLLFLVKAKSLDIPLSIINLAEVKEVTVNSSYFTIKTAHSGDYEFNSNSPAQAKTWKAEIEKRAEQSKLTRQAVLEKEEYQTALASYKDPKAAHHAKSPEAVTSDEEGALSGEDTKRPGKWSRRISGSFQRLTGPSKDKEIAPEPAKKEVSPAPVAEAPVTETPAVEETAPVTTETAVVDTPVEPATESTAEPSKKDKRKSLSGFTGLFGKSKATAKEPTPEPVSETKATEPTPTTESAVEETTPAVVESTEETPAVSSEPKPEKEKKRSSLFSGLIPKKDTKDKATTAPVVNGEQTETTEPTTSEPIVPVEETPTATSETKPETPKKDGLGRRLTSQFKSFGRSKSPDKGKSTKVSDEAPKIDTAIESTPETTTATETAAKTEEEPLSTTEAPLAPVEIKEEQKTAPVVSTQA